MKTKLITILALSWTLLASAQTASQYITAGTNDLAQNNWWGADTNFTAALALAPANPDANTLKAVTRLLVLPQTPAGSNLLVTIGFPKTNRYQFGFPLAGLPKDANGEPAFPANYNSSTLIAYFRNTVLAALTNSDVNLASVTDPTYNLMLSSNETGIESVTLDYGDIQMMRALMAGAQFMGYTLNANNFSVVMPQIVSFMENNTFNFQTILTTYPSLLAQQTPADLAFSKSALTNAIAHYFAASAFIRARPVDSTNNLFSLGEGEVAKEATFRTTLTNALLSLNTPTELSPSNANALASTAYLGAYFAGTHSVRSLMPQFNGDAYVNDTLPDYTFGGIVPDWPAYQTEAGLRKMFPTYAGIYIGDNGQFYNGNPAVSDNQGYQNGSFAVFVNTNRQAVLMGHDDTDGSGNSNFGIIAGFTVNKGNWQFTSNYVSGFGYISKDGSFNGELDYTNGINVYLNGSQQSPLGPFQSSAGLFKGTYNITAGFISSGNVQIVVAADGEVFFLPLQTSPSGSVGSGGGPGLLNTGNNQFSYTQVSGTTVAGTLNTNTFVISGILSGNVTGTFNNATRLANVLFDVPPVITRDLLLSTNVALGTNVTFSLSVTGSPPVSYQWFLNSNAIPGATAATLVVSNNLWQSLGTYYISASVNNCAGGTNSQQCAVNVTAETTPPTVAITSPTPGQLWSNATFNVTGTAADSVAVTNVYYSVNNSPFAPAMTANNWANWSTNVTLTAGTNTIAAYSVNVGGISSITKTSTVVYVVSGVLTVRTNGVGSIAPNYNGASLQIGNTYLVTATAGTGFMFTNWTGGTNLPFGVLTNGPALQFVMQSNLVLQANFMDTNKPVLAITNLVAGQMVSNAAFTVMGWATDNVAVAGVYCSLSNGLVNTGYGLVPTANNWLNWSTNETLAAGTNTLRAYAVDTSGNVSATNVVNFDYVVSGVLTVRTNGVGSIAPNYNGASLQIGNTYLVTATAGTGFMFTNWTGGTNLPFGVLTNGPALQFVMQSNLVLQANFMDTNKPVLAITNVVAGQMVSNAAFTVMGWATDNVAVAGVYCSLSNGLVNTGYGLAATANNWLNWSTNETLAAGTNTLRAYAVDTSGNVSATNVVNFDYVVSGVLTVRTNGVGSIAPNYNGASLQIGNTYLVTATAGTGFMFTNWTGGTNLPFGVLTNGPALQFVMQSNLVLQANFMDTNKPVLAITNVVAGQMVSNAAFTVMGWATDNVAVAGVYCSLSNGLVNTGYGLAATANNWLNWSTNETLAAGTNTLRAYAVDTSGNVSATNVVNFDYVVSGVLTVRTNGVGSIAPNYNGASLQIGNTYLVTATAGTGFMFTNWTGGTNLPFGVLTNGPALQFVMQSNLVLQANFMDTNKPVLAITNLVAGQMVSNAAFTVMGWATDNVAVAGVYCSLSNGLVNTGYGLAATANNWLNWSTNETLAAGTNTLRAYAVDTSGNVSATNVVNFDYVVSGVLTVRTNGVGSIAPNYNGASLQIGNTYLVTATAGTGFMFTNWTGGTNLPFGVLTNGPALQFVMQSNLVLQANFMDTNKPVLAITNLVAGQMVSNAAFTVMGWATDNVAVAGVYCSLSNGLVNTGYGLAATANNWLNWSTNETLAAGTNTLRAYAVDTSGNVSATNVVNFDYVVSGVLTVRTNGVGSIAPNYNGALLRIGATYSMTATPGTGYVFYRWTGSLSTNNSALTFVMASNLTFTANFENQTNPLVGINSASANQLLLTWPVGIANFAIQTNGNLSTTNWANYTGAVITTNGTIRQIIINPTNRNLFFRLIKPSGGGGGGGGGAG